MFQVADMDFELSTGGNVVFFPLKPIVKHLIDIPVLYLQNVHSDLWLFSFLCCLHNVLLLQYWLENCVMDFKKSYQTPTSTLKSKQGRPCPGRIPLQSPTGPFRSPLVSKFRSPPPTLYSHLSTNTAYLPSKQARGIKCNILPDDIFEQKGIYLRSECVGGGRSVTWGTNRVTSLQRLYIRETMHSALNLWCTIRAQLISATRGHASQPKVLVMATDCSATCQQG